MVVLGPASLKDRGATATFSQPGGPSGPQPGFQEGSLVQLVAICRGGTCARSTRSQRGSARPGWG